MEAEKIRMARGGVGCTAGAARGAGAGGTLLAGFSLAKQKHAPQKRVAVAKPLPVFACQSLFDCRFWGISGTLSQV